MDIVIAGGTEMMSHQPLGSDYPSKWPETFPTQLGTPGHQRRDDGEQMGLSREELDDFGYESHMRAMRAIQGGCFDSQILPIALPDGSCLSSMRGCACLLTGRKWPP
jgi:acetyl-CoA acyltransferase